VARSCNTLLVRTRPLAGCEVRARLSPVTMTQPLFALCVGRHQFLSEHLGLFFSKMGVETRCVVGLEEAVVAARERVPDTVICDYDLLATLPLDVWENDELLARVPLVAVSLTRRPEEVHLLDVNGIGGFLYLPTLDEDSALRVLTMPRRAPDDFSLGYGLRETPARSTPTN
jgi:hypothetical protein